MLAFALFAIFAYGDFEAEGLQPSDEIHRLLEEGDQEGDLDDLTFLDEDLLKQDEDLEEEDLLLRKKAEDSADFDED